MIGSASRIAIRTTVWAALVAVAAGADGSAGAEGADRVAVVRTLDGEARGTLVRLDDTSAVVDGFDGKNDLPTSRVLGVCLPPALTVPDPIGEAVFTDGSVAPFTDWRTDGATLELTLDGGESRVATLSAPTAAIRAFRPPPSATPPSDDANARWRTLLDGAAPADVLLLRGRQPGAVHEVEGVVAGWTDDGLAFALGPDGDDPVDVPWARIVGVVLFQDSGADGVQRAADGVVIRGARGLCIRGERLRVDADSVRLTGDRHRLDAPLSLVERIDLSAGKVTWLGEARASESDWRPFFAGGGVAVGGPPRRNEAFGGGPLRLRFPDPRVDGAWTERSFATGWAIRSRGEVSLELPPWGRRLRGWVGIDPATWATGAAEVVVFADDAERFRTPVAMRSAPIGLDVDVAGASSVRLLVDYGPNLDTGDNVHFADLRVTR